jgi:hypothetical protein
VPNNFILFYHLLLALKNNDILQLGTILNNEGCVLESFFQFFGMADQCFLFLQILATW